MTKSRRSLAALIDGINKYNTIHRPYIERSNFSFFYVNKNYRGACLLNKQLM